ncbi:MAG: lipopolysaccharide biosynthesis protein [Phycisphaerae bacterium]|nr:lipopolysaccharide biosynthesis protein [Phycisphaerae bacterium]
MIRMASTAVLARLLTPADFGLVAMGTVVTGFVDVFRDGGLSTATVQHERLTHAHVSTLFWLNVVFGAVVMSIIAGLAPILAWFYGEPRLVPLVLALAAMSLLGGFGIQHMALLRRQMRFGAVAAIELSAMTVGASIASAMAWAGYSYWSLVAMTAANLITAIALAWLTSGWIPGVPRRSTGIGKLVLFGGHLAGYNAINYLARQADQFLIGWWWGAAPLGLYSKAYSLLTLPIAQFNLPIESVTIPMLSRLRAEPNRYRAAFRRVVSILAWATIPLIGGLLVTSDWVVRLFLGPQWTAATPIFLILGLCAPAQVMYNTAYWVLVSSGQGERCLRMSLIAAGPLVASFLFGLPFGPKGVAGAYAITSSLIVSPLLFRYASCGSPIRQSDFYRAAVYPVLAASGVVACVLVLRCLCGLSNPLAGIGVAFAVALAVAACGVQACIRRPQ